MTSSVVSVRVSEQERALLESAAMETHTNLSDFVRRRSVEAAQAALMDLRTIEVSATKWDEIDKLMDAPAKVDPAVEELAEIAAQWNATAK